MLNEHDTPTARSPGSLAAVFLATLTFLFVLAVVAGPLAAMAMLRDTGPTLGPLDQPILYIISIAVMSLIPAILCSRYVYRRVAWSEERLHDHRRKGMHWFLRGLIAIGVMYVVSGLVSAVLWTFVYGIATFGQALLMTFIPQPTSLLYFALMAVPLVVYANVTKRYGPITLERETRCRQCQYILRGISEPRCPECGERI